jgi:hypothetical protein
MRPKSNFETTYNTRILHMLLGDIPMSDEEHALDHARGTLLFAANLVNEMVKANDDVHAKEVSTALGCAKKELSDASVEYTKAFAAFEQYKKDLVSNDGRE